VKNQPNGYLMKELGARIIKMTNKDLKRRIIEISYKKGLSHIGSCLTAVDIINEIYETKERNEKFVLSSGHAGLALYCIIEKYSKKIHDELHEISAIGTLNAEKIFDHHGVHPDRCLECGIDCSSGSLGHGLGVSVGMALADRSKNVYCLISDGEYAEGSIHEALRIIREQKLNNLKVYMNNNGYAAYRETDIGVFPSFIQMRHTNMDGWPSCLQGQIAHYKVLNEAEYLECLEVVK
jgi:transketolase